MTSVTEFLEHHGVLGQKWGVRKNRKQVTTSIDHKRVKKLRGKRSSQLSNQQLKLLNERKNLEQNFSRLNPGTVAKGLAATASILGAIDLGIRAFNQFNSPAGRALIKTGKKFVIRTV